MCISYHFLIYFTAVCSTICISTVNGYRMCSYLSWSTDTAQNCTEGSTERTTLFAVSFIPLGVGKFYSGEYFDGIFELLQGIIAITSVLVWYYCRRKNVKRLSDVLLTIALFLCFALEIGHMICSKLVELFYIIVMVISLVLTCGLRYCCLNDFLTVIVTISTMCLLIASDALMVYFFKEVDGHGCPLIH